MALAMVSAAFTKSGSANGVFAEASCVRMPARPLSSVADTLPVILCCEYSARSRAATPVTSGAIASASSTTSGNVAPNPPMVTVAMLGSAWDEAAPLILQDGQNTTKPVLAVTLADAPKFEKLFLPAGAWTRTG